MGRHNQMTSEIDPLGVVTIFGYDPAGNQTSVTRNMVQGHAPTETVNVTTGYTTTRPET